MNEECDRLNKLVEDASENVQLEAGEIELEFRAVPVHELIDAALVNCKSSLVTRDVRVQVPDGYLQSALIWHAARRSGATSRECEFVLGKGQANRCECRE